MLKHLLSEELEKLVAGMTAEEFIAMRRDAERYRAVRKGPGHGDKGRMIGVHYDDGYDVVHWGDAADRRADEAIAYAKANEQPKPSID